MRTFLTVLITIILVVLVYRHYGPNNILSKTADGVFALARGTGNFIYNLTH